MKERPILFSAPMIRALLDGSKTQTRRVVKCHVEDYDGALITGTACPYGQPGDRLWVREAFDFLPAGGPDQPQACEIVYWATGSTEQRTAPHDYNPMIYGHEKVRPSIHMPRWASRITLEITSVRVERLQDISESDAQAEGAIPNDGYAGPAEDRQKGWVTAYRSIWKSINGADSWAANPYVWVIEFKRVTP